MVNGEDAETLDRTLKGIDHTFKWLFVSYIQPELKHFSSKGKGESSLTKRV